MEFEGKKIVNRRHRLSSRKTPSFARMTASASIRSSFALNNHPSERREASSRAQRRMDNDPIDVAVNVKAVEAPPNLDQRAIQVQMSFERRLQEMLLSIRASLQESFNVEVAQALSSRSHEDRMRNVYCGLDAIIEEGHQECQPEATLSPTPRAPSHDTNQRKSNLQSESQTFSVSQCGLSPNPPSQCSEHNTPPTTPPVTPQTDRYCGGSPRVVSPLRIQVLETLLPSPSKPFAEKIDLSSSSSSLESLEYDTLHIDSPLLAAHAIREAPFKNHSTKDFTHELEEYAAWSQPKISRTPWYMEASQPRSWLLNHNDEPAKFIRWVSEQNVFHSAPDCCASDTTVILDAAIDHVMRSTIRDVILDALAQL